MLQHKPHLVDLADWLIRLTVADVEHPEDLLEPVAGEHLPEKGDLTDPGGLPVILKFGQVDEAHVEDDGEEAVQVRVVTHYSSSITMHSPALKNSSKKFFF